MRNPVDHGGDARCITGRSRNQHRRITGVPSIRAHHQDEAGRTRSRHHNLHTDRGWENRRLILASLAPRTATRPAHRGAVPGVDGDLTDDPEATKKPGLLTRGMRATGPTAAAGGRTFNKRVPLENRMRTGILTAAAIVILLVALAFVNFATTDVNPSTNSTTATAAPPPPPTQPPLRRDAILSGVKATDVCPRDPNYSDSNRAFETATSTPRGYAPEPTIRKASSFKSTSDAR